MKPKASIRLFLSIVSVAVTGGCQNASLTSVPADPRTATPQEGVIYSLPKTYFTVKAKFDVWVEEPLPEKNPEEDKPAAPAKKDAPPVKSAPTPAPELTADQKAAKAAAEAEAKKRYAFLLISRDEGGLTLTSSERRDPDQTYVLESGDSAWTDISEHAITLTEEGFLASVNTTYTDKRAAVIGNSVGAAINLAKILTLKSQGRPYRTFKKAEKGYEMQRTYSAEEVFASYEHSKLPFKDFLAKIKSGAPDDLVTQFEGFTWVDNLYPEIKLALEQVDGITLETPTKPEEEQKQPKVAAKAPMTAADLANLVDHADQAPGEKTKAAKKIPGIAYRVPGSALAGIYIDSVPAFEAVVNIYQLGQLGYIDVSSRAFSTRTIKLTLTKGMLTKYEKNATSSAEGFSKMLNDQSAAVKDAYASYLTDKATKATAAETKSAAQETKEKTALADEIARQRNIRSKEIDLEAVNRKLEINRIRQSKAETEDEKEAARVEEDSLRKQKIGLEAEIDALSKSVILPASA